MWATVNGVIDDAAIERSETYEAAEARYVQMYETALQIQKSGHWNEAKDTFLTLLEQIVSKQNETGNNQTAKRIQYLCLQNVGILEHHLGHLVRSLDFWIQASEIDSTDVTLWYRIGKTSEDTKNLRLARYAYERGLVCSPRHWLCLIRLIHILAILKDDDACAKHLRQACDLDDTCNFAQIHRARLLVSMRNGVVGNMKHSLAALTSYLRNLRLERLNLCHERSCFDLDDVEEEGSRKLVIMTGSDTHSPWWRLGQALLDDFVKVQNRSHALNQKIVIMISHQSTAVENQSTEMAAEEAPHKHNTPNESIKRLQESTPVKRRESKRVRANKEAEHTAAQDRRSSILHSLMPFLIEYESSKIEADYHAGIYVGGDAPKINLAHDQLWNPEQPQYLQQIPVDAPREESAINGTHADTTGSAEPVILDQTEEVEKLVENFVAHCSGSFRIIEIMRQYMSWTAHYDCFPDINLASNLQLLFHTECIMRNHFGAQRRGGRHIKTEERSCLPVIASASGSLGYEVEMFLAECHWAAHCKCNEDTDKHHMTESLTIVQRLLCDIPEENTIVQPQQRIGWLRRRLRLLSLKSFLEEKFLSSIDSVSPSNFECEKSSTAIASQTMEACLHLATELLPLLVSPTSENIPTPNGECGAPIDGSHVMLCACTQYIGNISVSTIQRRLNQLRSKLKLQSARSAFALALQLEQDNFSDISVRRSNELKAQRQYVVVLEILMSRYFSGFSGLDDMSYVELDDRHVEILNELKVYCTVQNKRSNFQTVLGMMVSCCAKGRVLEGDILQARIQRACLLLIAQMFKLLIAQMGRDLDQRDPDQGCKVCTRLVAVMDHLLDLLLKLAAEETFFQAFRMLEKDTQQTLFRGVVKLSTTLVQLAWTEETQEYTYSQSIGVAEKALLLLCERMATPVSSDSDRLGELGSWPWAARIIGCLFDMGYTAIIDNSLPTNTENDMIPLFKACTSIPPEKEAKTVHLLRFALTALHQLLRLIMHTQRRLVAMDKFSVQELRMCFTVDERKYIRRQIIILIQFIEQSQERKSPNNQQQKTPIHHRKRARGDGVMQEGHTFVGSEPSWFSLRQLAIVTLLRLVRADDYTQQAPAKFEVSADQQANDIAKSTYHIRLVRLVEVVVQYLGERGLFCCRALALPWPWIHGVMLRQQKLEHAEKMGANMESDYKGRESLWLCLHYLSDCQAHLCDDTRPTNTTALQRGMQVKVIATQKGQKWFRGEILGGDLVSGYEIKYDDGDCEAKVLSDRIRLITASSIGNEMATSAIAKIYYSLHGVQLKTLSTCSRFEIPHVKPPRLNDAARLFNHAVKMMRQDHLTASKDILNVLELVYLSFKDHLPCTAAKFQISNYLCDRCESPLEKMFGQSKAQSSVDDSWAKSYTEKARDLLKHLSTPTVYTHRFIEVHRQLYTLLTNHRPLPKLKKVKGRYTVAALEDWYRQQNDLADLYERGLAFHPDEEDSWFQLGVCFRQMLTLKLDEAQRNHVFAEWWGSRKWSSLSVCCKREQIHKESVEIYSFQHYQAQNQHSNTCVEHGRRHCNDGQIEEKPSQDNKSSDCSEKQSCDTMHTLRLKAKRCFVMAALLCESKRGLSEGDDTHRMMRMQRELMAVEQLGVLVFNQLQDTAHSKTDEKKKLISEAQDHFQRAYKLASKQQLMTAKEHCGTSWVFPLMLGKLFFKAHNHEAALHYYAISAQWAKMHGCRQEQSRVGNQANDDNLDVRNCRTVPEPLYKLHSARLKLLLRMVHQNAKFCCRVAASISADASTAAFASLARTGCIRDAHDLLRKDAHSGEDRAIWDKQLAKSQILLSLLERFNFTALPNSMPTNRASPQDAGLDRPQGWIQRQRNILFNCLVALRLCSRLWGDGSNHRALYSIAKAIGEGSLLVPEQTRTKLLELTTEEQNMNENENVDESAVLDRQQHQPTQRKIKRRALERIREFTAELPEVKSRIRHELESRRKKLRMQKMEAWCGMLRPLGAQASAALCDVEPEIGFLAAKKILGKLFDRKRPQVVNVWITDTATNPLQMLDQRGQKYDRVRSKYIYAYTDLLLYTRSGDVLRNLCSWIAASVNATREDEPEKSTMLFVLAYVVEARRALLTSRRVELESGDAGSRELSIFECMEDAYDSYLVCLERHLRPLLISDTKAALRAELTRLFVMAAPNNAPDHLEFKNVLAFCHSKWENKCGRSKITKSVLSRKRIINN